MKNNFRILGVTFLAAVYCFAAINVSYSLKSFDFGNQSTNEEEQYRDITSKSIFCHTSPTESLVSSVTNSSASNFNNFSFKLWSISQFDEKLIEAKFIQYCNFSINFLIQFRKSDLIFPFHYFW